MNRILIGDVGSGKTAVAMISSYLVAKNGTQTAILAPTEILAKQHYRNFCNIFPEIKNRIGLLTGSVKGQERSRIQGDIELGMVKIIIGTHALLEENIRFKNLTYVIIDEQHQFGINQRARIKAKGLATDLLMMSATPIPRTLAISLYGDLDISMIKELPPGRKEIITKVVRGDKAEKLYYEIREQILKNDAQCYIVYPIISESEKLDLKAAEEMYEKLKSTFFRDISVGLLHGRMKDDEKNEIMNRFKEGRLKILIATTVIEVGVDVPTASIMVIEHAERFGLSQLHQLRGRVGRGSKESFCYLVAYNYLTENAYERLRIMEKTNNGFKIAEEDMRIRGPGELAGTKQSGIPDFHMSNLIRDADILEETRTAAFLSLIHI
ncbi:MAG: ATP-dependent DNA helicase RecG, partial [Deltaproteobacteria bacterium]|nr:ATP-dependent DNA helicase RecG [Deltaproteobacteria bacterium]